MHASLTLNKIVRAVRRNMSHDEYTGFCTSCGRKAKQPCEPDAEGYTCQFTRCGQPTVYGAEQLLFLVQS